MGRLVEYILLLLSVVLVVSTLTGSTNNYYNEPTKVTDCSVTKKFAEFTNASLTPNPMTRGKAYYVKGTFYIKKTIQWGILHIKLTYNFKKYTNITFVNEKFNLCDYLDDLLNILCPVPPGIYHFNYSNIVPKLFWPGRYYGKATAYNEEGEEMMCQMTEVTIN
ncbi:PREDICTED: putative phosphatidylglycerol/phosphatidylinositol transfer protein DDB_G0278295 isoform X3 [Amphimedon queenslandica]|uniref:MD-2-related lipid-recognition domain-containing protein n=1 Tax=Amphimedon queenslandica TaxID=400682 RepID=A0AAN0JR45_AMPQE|nr:PREDICTED: putative phosphatidylglycerol/phosphatidylinositol transfer protein DDB_G0278295 isoform X3 [Amphimedon queenslandica]|eukprot:XP_019859315.1 PREDICTED: putative phosphatidylglycerol/phosphatidylinositol transfer protein DDB_G0278295 isoform X3 [Amphimedon queenslandica]